MTPEHREARKGRITGSRIGAICGLNPYTSADDVMREMVREHHGLEPEFTGNAATRWGNEHEVHGLQWMEDNAGHLYELGRFITIENWAGSAPDAFINGTPVEVKCPYTGKLRDVRSTPHEMAQCLWHCYAASANECYYVCWTEADVTMETVRRKDIVTTAFGDELTLKGLVEVGRGFWHRLQTTLADPDLCAPYLRDRVTERADDDWTRAALTYRNAKQAADMAATALETAKQTLIDLSDHTSQRGNGVLVTQCAPSMRTDYRKAATDAGADLSKYQSEGKPSWRVTVDA